MTDEKRCNSCHVLRPLSMFVASKSSKGGYRTVCKPCHSRKERERRRLLKGNKLRTKRPDIRGVVGLVCAHCDRDMPEDRFAPSKLSPLGRNSVCRDCSSLRIYGLNHLTYWERFEGQGGVCALCGQVGRPSRGTRPLDVDHCHDTGRVRSLLCGPCNRGLGFFGEDPRRLRKAAAYLEVHRQRVG